MTRRCQTLLLVLTVIFSCSPTIKSAVDHGLVKKYFLELYNEALVRAMQEQGQVQEKPVRRSYDHFIPYSQQAGQNYSPQSAWKGEPKHKESLHFVFDEFELDLLSPNVTYLWGFWFESKWNCFIFSINTILTIISTGSWDFISRI